MRNISYRGKKVSVGIDVHAASYHATCVVSGEIVKSVTMKASPENLLKFLKRTFPGSEIESAYEAGFSGFELHRTLVAGGIKSIAQAGTQTIQANTDQMEILADQFLGGDAQMLADRLIDHGNASACIQGKNDFVCAFDKFAILLF